MRLTVSAPGKLFVLGEHAVVYDGQAIVTAIDSRLSLHLRHEDGATPNQLHIHAPDVKLNHWIKDLSLVFAAHDNGASAFIESCVTVFNEVHPIKGSLWIETQTDFGAQFGLGSSSATVAATIFALDQLFGTQLSRMQQFEMGLTAIQGVQKLGSGADLAAAIFGGTIHYENIAPRKVTTISLVNLPLSIIYSGHKAGTVSYVKQVKALREDFPDVIDPIIQTMLKIVDEGKKALEIQAWQTLGTLMNIQHGLLHAIGVDTKALANIVLMARENGAFGAKLSGAGGGDCAIVLSNSAKQASLSANLEVLGLEVLPFKANAEGVRVDA